MAHMTSVVFGPLPSRRLGRSLGINTLPSKTCSYNCVYCQLGRTTAPRSVRRNCVAPALLEQAVAERLSTSADGIDALTFVSAGEPTLDARLGESIRRLKPFGIRIAVVTNASLLWRADVRDDLALADWVSLKVDTVLEPTWRRLNRPVRTLRLEQVLDGVATFARSYTGTLTTETMLVDGANDEDDDVRSVADFLRLVRPTPAFLILPVRPPTEAWVLPATGRALARARDTFARASVPVRCLVDEADGDFTGREDAASALLATAAVHPLHRAALQKLLDDCGNDWSLVERLVQQGELSPVTYRGRVFYRTVGARRRRLGTRRPPRQQKGDEP